MKYLKSFNEDTTSNYTLSDYINDKFELFNDQVGRGKKDTEVPGLVKSRAWTGLLLLTQATSKEQNLTSTIVEIAKILDPIMRDIGPYARDKYQYIIDPNSWLHNRDFNEKEYINRVVGAYPPLDFILHWYFEADAEPPFDLNEYSKLCSKMKSEAEKVFSKSIWSKSDKKNGKN